MTLWTALMILVVGNINFDILLPVDRLPAPHEKLTCPDAVTSFGGSAANTAYWLARIGLPVTLAGSVGDDPMGQAHLEHLAAAGVGVEGVVRVNFPSGLAVVLSHGREKRMIRVPGANAHGKVLPDLVAGCRLVYLSGADLPVLRGYAAAARGKGIPVVCGRHGAQDSALASAAEGFVLNSDEVRELTGLDDPAEGIAALDAQLAAVTLPTGGALVSEGIETHAVPAPELDPVDRTGGGDAFAAGFLAGLHLGRDLRTCARMGNSMAAAVIMERGARPDVPVPEEVRREVGKKGKGKSASRRLGPENK